MKIPFTKIQKGQDYLLKIDNENFSIEATFNFQSKNITMLLCDLKFQGQIKSICNSCGDNIVINVDENIDFLVSDGVFNGFDEEFDVVEALNGSIDLEEILLSELELMASDYFHCGKCEAIDEREF